MESQEGRKTRCPRCGSSWVCRAYRIGVVERHLLRALHLSPYRCDRCDRRFYRRSATHLRKGRIPTLQNQ